MAASPVPAISPPSIQPLLASRRRILVTGGADFIGGAVVRRLLKDSDTLVFNLDKCGYASNLTSIEQLPAERQAAFRFHHISTDEVFGSLGAMSRFSETTPYDPRSPYSASKAASDHLVRAWHHTYGLPVVLTNCSNNYGPWQFPEKLIPVVILKAATGEPIPLNGDGLNVRDWLTVDDHVDALLPAGAPHSQLITPVSDRPGHDRRYAIDRSRISSELGCSRATASRPAWRPPCAGISIIRTGAARCASRAATAAAGWGCWRGLATAGAD